jgi:putative acetyltransferase
MTGKFEIQNDNLSGSATQTLIEFHLREMHKSSPPGTAFALDLTGLRDPSVTFWSLWMDANIAAIGALKQLDCTSAEVKSMRTHPDYLRRGAAAVLLAHIIATAQAHGYRRLSLETGSSPAFEPALALYRARGFVEGSAFGDY